MSQLRDTGSVLDESSSPLSPKKCAAVLGLLDAFCVLRPYRYRKRCKRGVFWRSIMVTKDQLDELENCGYLGPDLRGERADECDAGDISHLLL
jgi:hypothetical protein